MADILAIEAERFAKENDYILWPRRCDKCFWPLFQEKTQRVPFCVSCYRDDEQAQRGHDLLERIQRGITVRHVGPEIFIEQRNVA